jgi:hypothetical protein
MRNLQTYDDFLFESVLNEIGDMKPLDWDDIKINGKETVYEFYLGPEFYEVVLYSRNPETVDVSFKSNGDDKNVTNSGQPFLVFSTVMNIVKDYIKNHPLIASFTFVPEKADFEDSRREKIYLHYIKNSFPGAGVRKEEFSRGYLMFTVNLK